MKRPDLHGLVVPLLLLGAWEYASRQGAAGAYAFVPLAQVGTALAELLGSGELLVNLWATWCPPCVREMPVLLQAQMNHPEVNFVFINQGESAQRVQTWLGTRQLPSRNVLLDANQQALPAFKQKGLPTTLFFDAQGQLVDTRTGELSTATLAQRLQTLSAPMAAP